jgi:glucose-1-phosphate thymidylyltransferase
VQRLVEDIAAVCAETVDEIAYIIGDFGKDVEASLIQVAEDLGAKGTIYYQDEALGTAHAIMCAEASLSGKVIVAFADTLFRADFKLDDEQEGIIWVQQIDDPSAFGVVKLDDNNVITDFIEKPADFVSDLAIIGIYYFKDGDNLKSELKYLLDNNITDRGEYQLTDALENMKQKGLKFKPGKVVEWLDCGNKNATVYTNQRVLEFIKDSELVDPSATVENSVIIPPCLVGPNAVVKNSVIGPHVSIGENTVIENTVMSNSIVQTNTKIKGANIVNSMVGNFVQYEKAAADISVGDYNQIKD